MTDSIERTVKKNLRVRPGEWERIERAAEGIGGYGTGDMTNRPHRVRSIQDRHRHDDGGGGRARNRRLSPRNGSGHATPNIEHCSVGEQRGERELNGKRNARAHRRVGKRDDIDARQAWKRDEHNRKTRVGEIGALAASTSNSFGRLAAQCRDAGCSGGGDDA